MKNLNRVVILVLTISSLLISCKSKAPKNWIVNKWKLTDLQGRSVSEMGDSLKNIYLKSFVIEFNKEGKFTSNDHFAGTVTGKYSLSDDGKSLMTTNEGSEQTDTVKIESLTDKELVISKDAVKMICQPFK
ncbi:MAG: hypothetical protein WCJ85_06085 [Chitinophagaceae bacterium]